MCTRHHRVIRILIRRLRQADDLRVEYYRRMVAAESLAAAWREAAEAEEEARREALRQE